MKQLSEIVEIIKGNKAPKVFNNPRANTHRYLQIEDLRPGSILKYAHDDKGTLAKKNDVLIAWDGANAGTVGFGLEGYAGSTIAVLRPRVRDIYGPFLGYFLHSKFEDIQAHCTGATIPHVSRSYLETLQLHFPTHSEQKSIAAILAKADRLRRLRRYTLELSSTYLQTVFLEMFGDPIINPKNWQIRPLRGISLKFSDGPFGSNLKTEHYTSSGIRVIRLQNIGIGQLINDDKAYISEAHFATLGKHLCLPGDVIVGTLGDPNLRACILPSFFSVAVNKADCVQIRVDPNEATTEYICWLLNLPHTLFLAKGMIHGQTRDRINMGRLAELKVPIPPLSLQEHFSLIVQRYDRLRIQQREALRQADHLFQTLLYQAFHVELKLETAPLPFTAEIENADDTLIIPNLSDTTEGEIYQLSLPVE